LNVRTLPDYRTPPVVEVAISALFVPPAGLNTVRFGEFWRENQVLYPRCEDYPPIFDTMPTEIAALPPLRRVFMISQDERYVLQLQANALIHNWRKLKDSDEYPRFEVASKLFRERLTLFAEFVKKNQLGELKATSYEVTYVNHLSSSENMAEVFDQEIALMRLQPPNDRKLLPSPLGINADIRFDLPNDIGTLRVSFKHGARISDQREVLQLELTARGTAKPDFSDMDNWLEVAHEWIVRGFTEITTQRAQQTWGRTL
jgi:uncharacterized protein (TIGR04255 family)